MHRQRIFSCLCALALIASYTVASFAAEQIDDPSYTYWCKFKPGSTSTVTTETDAAGQKMLMNMTYTLLDVAPAKVTVETKTETSSGTTKLTPRVMKREVPAKRDKPANSTIKESKEDVTVGAKTYACHLFEEMRGTLHIKTWMSDKVPGGLVKMEMNDDGLSMKSHLVEFTVK